MMGAADHEEKGDQIVDEMQIAAEIRPDMDLCDANLDTEQIREVGVFFIIWPHFDL